MDRFFFRTLELEHPLDERGFCIGAHKRGVRLAPDEHDHRVEDDRFARAGLTREDDQTGTKPQLELVDNRKIMDSEFCKHRPF